MNEHPEKLASAALCSAARKRQPGWPPANASIGEGDIDSRRLVQELLLHQMELETQNAALQQARVETEAALARYADFYDFAPVGYLTLDRNGVIRQLNVAVAELLGTERAEMVGLRFRVFVDKRDRHEFNAFLTRVFDGCGKERCELALGMQEGSGAPSFVRIEAVLGKSGKTCSAVVVDITEQKRAALLLKTHRDQLEAMVAERTTQLSQANQELEGFTYAASHDMKAPLGRIIAFGNLLGQKYRTQLDLDGLQFLDLIQQNAQRLNLLIDDLLAHAQIGQRSFDRYPVDVSASARTLLLEWADDIRQAGIEVRIDLPAEFTVPADPLSLQQVLRNLLENALKYSSRSQPPRIEIGGRVEDEGYHLWVNDNGIGIDPAYQERIFEIFRRLHTYDEFPGTGVGLALVKKAMARMGGRVWVESTLGQGATFHLELPL